MRIDRYRVGWSESFTLFLPREAHLIHAFPIQNVFGSVDLWFEIEEGMATTPIQRQFIWLTDGFEYGEHLAWEFLRVVKLPNQHCDYLIRFLYEDHQPTF